MYKCVIEILKNNKHTNYGLIIKIQGVHIMPQAVANVIQKRVRFFDYVGLGLIYIY